MVDLNKIIITFGFIIKKIGFIIIIIIAEPLATCIIKS